MVATQHSIKPYHKVPDFFISLSNETGNLISNLQLQKLLYYSQAWHLGKTRQPLFEDDFEAWVHGPVLPELFDHYSNFSWLPIVRKDLTEGCHDKIREQFPKKSLEVLDFVVDQYFELNSYRMEVLSRQEKPWITARHGLLEDEVSHNKISKKDMTRFYGKFFK